MSNITKCQGIKDTGQECPLRDTCLHYTYEHDPHTWVAHYVASPWFNGSCEMYDETSKQSSTTK